MPAKTIDDVSINYLHLGEGTNAQRVIYIHGTGCTGQVFSRHLNVISKDHEVVALDLPGHGDSTGKGYRGVGDYAFFAAQLVEQLGWPQCVVAGHSLGGGIALAVALYFPQLVKALMMIDSGARLRVAPATIAASKRLAAGEVKPKALNRLGFADSTSEEVVRATQALNANCSADTTYRDWIADDTCDFMSRVAAIEVPTLAICGREDPLTPLKYHEFMRDNMPNCCLEVIDGAGHWPFVEQPAHFDTAVSRFLQDLPL
ncbi:MAG: alpha/beta hydrolase [Pseudomonadota bacterium]